MKEEIIEQKRGKRSFFGKIEIGRGVWGNVSVPTMDIALERIRVCIDGILDLSHLTLTKLPPLPPTLTHLNCSHNELTSLTELPSSLLELICSHNPLTSLPPLPPSLTQIICIHSHLATLPPLPPFLYLMVCCHNELTSLPSLPPHLRILMCSENDLTSLPLLPTTLQYLDCNTNHIRFLPSLPAGLITLGCEENPLETLPELPLSLLNLTCGLPILNYQQDVAHLNPERVQEINQEIRDWMAIMAQDSMDRCMKRCSLYKEEIMMKVWHPSRVEKLLEMGYDMEDM